MALKDLFTAQKLNQALPSDLPGDAEGWELSARNREVMVDPTLAETVEILPTQPLKLVATSGYKEVATPLTDPTADAVYGYVIRNTKFYIHGSKRNNIATLARDGQIMKFAYKTAISAGAIAYLDTADGFATATSGATTVKLGLALQAVVGATDISPVTARVEVQTARV